MVKQYIKDTVDPHNEKGKYENWKKNGKQLNTSKANINLISEYLEDMEHGHNVSGYVMGGRSFSRLNALRVRLPKIAGFYEKLYNKPLVECTRKEITNLFHQIRNGAIKKLDGKDYKSTDDFVKDFKAFWHWYMKRERRLYEDTKDEKDKKKRKGSIVLDVTDDISEMDKKEPKFVYFTIDQLQKLLDNSKFKYKVLMLFMFDSIVRSPSELSNIKVSDITDIKNSNKLELNIREEISKTFKRTIKLMLSHKLIKRYIKENKLKPNDYLFKITPRLVNEYLKRTAKKVLGDGMTKGGKPYSQLTMYDFRHSGICYWLGKYKSEIAMRYRSGHKDSEMINWYSKNFIGMQDSIVEEDLEDVETRTELQKQLAEERKSREILEEKFNSEMEQLKKATEVIMNLYKKKK